MRVEAVDYGLDLGLSDLVRAPGLHASDAYGALYKFLEPKRYDFDGPPNHVLMMLGSAFENKFEDLLKRNGYDVQRPAEFTSPEGIHFSPDLILVDRKGIARLGEMKLTSMSVEDIPETGQIELPPKFDKYTCQMMLYAYWLGTFHGVLFVCSIRKPWAPDLRCFEIEWTERDLLENYQTVMGYAKHAGLLDKIQRRG